MLLITNVPSDKGLLTKVTQGHFGNFKVTQSIQYKNAFLTFLQITIKDTDMKSSETYTECYRQYMQYIRYGPWDQPHPPRNGKLLISKKLLRYTPLNHIFLFLVLQAIYAVH
jgi:hypothetical protein